MYSHEGHHVGDAWDFVDESSDVVHMFYLALPLADQSDAAAAPGSTPWIIGHATSRDLVHWQRQPPALQTGEPGSWDDLILCTGSVIQRGGRYWLAYSATSSKDSSAEEPFRVQRAGMAVSNDLTNWERLRDSPTTIAGPPHYEQIGTGERKMAHWRDPYLYDAVDSAYQLICARRVDGDPDTRGTVAVTRSTDMLRWEVLPPLEHDRIAQEMEVPQIYQINGRWYLMFCTLGQFLSPAFRARFGNACPGRSNFSMVSNAPLGPYRIHGTGQVVPHGPDEYFYAAQLVELRGQWHLMATIHHKDGDRTTGRIADPVPVVADETGIHARR